MLPPEEGRPRPEDNAWRAKAAEFWGDKPRALTYCRLAASQGHPIAQKNLPRLQALGSQNPTSKQNNSLTQCVPPPLPQPFPPLARSQGSVRSKSPTSHADQQAAIDKQRQLFAQYSQQPRKPGVAQQNNALPQKVSLPLTQFIDPSTGLPFSADNTQKLIEHERVVDQFTKLLAPEYSTPAELQRVVKRKVAWHYKEKCGEVLRAKQQADFERQRQILNRPLQPQKPGIAQQNNALPQMGSLPLTQLICPGTGLPYSADITHRLIEEKQEEAKWKEILAPVCKTPEELQRQVQRKVGEHMREKYIDKPLRDKQKAELEMQRKVLDDAQKRLQEKQEKSKPPLKGSHDSGPPSQEK